MGTLDCLHLASNTYVWNFTVADVTRPLLGADFLHSKALLVDLQGRRLVDAATFLSVPLSPTTAPAPHLNAISISTDQFDMHLAEFPNITTPNFTQAPCRHGVEHHVRVTKCSGQLSLRPEEKNSYPNIHTRIYI